jgi:acyl-CoA synthetase (NDP forming)
MEFLEKNIFEPKQVALVGASDLRGPAIAYATFFLRILENMREFKKFYPIDLSGKAPGCEKSVSRIPKDCDLAGVVLPEPLLSKNFRKVASRSRNVVIFAPEVSQKLSAEFEKVARKTTVIGPFSSGIISSAARLFLTPEKLPSPEPVALVSKDGELSSYILQELRRNRVGVEKLLCLGKGSVIWPLAYLAEDKNTNVICIHVQDPVEGRKLSESIRLATSKKPVVVFKSDRMSAIFESAIRQSGGALARDIEGFVAGARLLSTKPPPHEEKVAVLSNSKAFLKMAQRYLEEEKLVSSLPDQKTLETLSKKLPATIIDGGVLLSPEVENFKVAVEILSKDESLGCILCIYHAFHSDLDLESVNSLVERVEKIKDKLVVLCLPAPGELLSRLKSPRNVFTDLRACVAGLEISFSGWKAVAKAQRGK